MTIVAGEIRRNRVGYPPKALWAIIEQLRNNAVLDSPQAISQNHLSILHLFNYN